MRVKHCVQRTNIQNLKAIHNTPWSRPSWWPLCSKNEYTKSESNSQRVALGARISLDCVQRTNIQNLKAIHNTSSLLATNQTIVFKERIYKIWKQFTTLSPSPPAGSALCSKNEYTKSESNSQLIGVIVAIIPNCVQRTNIQNLKAIHNCPPQADRTCFIVFKERIYKIWKQFTTNLYVPNDSSVLCSKNEYTKSESNSQQSPDGLPYGADCVQRTNIQNLKAIHNECDESLRTFAIVFKERIYKIWKQFTTLALRLEPPGLLCSKNEYTKSESNSQLIACCLDLLVNCVQRTNIQNLKAIHNCVCWIYTGIRLCSKNEYTKSESNSQRIASMVLPGEDCVQRTNIQNLKAIHNVERNRDDSLHIVFKERIYKIWKQFTTGRLRRAGKASLCSKNEYTKSESNSQLKSRTNKITYNCVQRTNIQNLKAIHNCRCFLFLFACIVFKERIYKIWKQFTT